MLKNKVVCCCLLMFLLAFGSAAAASAAASISPAEAAASTAPYASILAYTQNAYNVGTSGPTMNMLAVLNIINLTPWEIYIGDPKASDIMHGFNGPKITTQTQPSASQQIPLTPQEVDPFWLKGINNVKDSSGKGGTSATGSAFHSVQIALNNPNNAWIQSLQHDPFNTPSPANPNFSPISTDLTFQASASGPPDPSWGWYQGETGYISVPILFNSSNGVPGGNTVALNFMVTSSMGFAQVENNNGMGTYSYSPAYALSFGGGANPSNNFGWASQVTNVPKYKGNPGQVTTKNVSQFLTIQAQGQNANNWQPVPTANGVYTGTVQHPTYLNSAALAYPNFSTVANVTAVPGVEYDLVVMLQSGDYADCSLIFLAVPKTGQ